MTKRAIFLASSSLALILALPGHAVADPLWPPIMRDVTPTSASVTADVGDVIPGEIVVDVKDDLSDSEIQQLGREFHITLRDNSPGVKDDGNVTVADVPPSEVSALVARHAADPRVEAAEPAGLAQILWPPNDP